jgi:hypothetical protein
VLTEGSDVALLADRLKNKFSLTSVMGRLASELCVCASAVLDGEVLGGWLAGSELTLVPNHNREEDVFGDDDC